ATAFANTNVAARSDIAATLVNSQGVATTYRPVAACTRRRDVREDHPKRPCSSSASPTNAPSSRNDSTSAAASLPPSGQDVSGLKGCRPLDGTFQRNVTAIDRSPIG